jgi:NAD(P)-dependent dehydrogenase (short-subunit alcohol dehydrogenase family)
LGHSVVISSRGNVAVAAAVAEVAAGPGGGKVAGQPCDVSQCDQVQVLWDAAAAALGSVDIYINNAGLGGPKLNLPQLTRADIEPVIATNDWGTSWAIMP